jgi:hypothetical protein
MVCEGGTYALCQYCVQMYLFENILNYLQRSSLMKIYIVLEQIKPLILFKQTSTYTHAGFTYIPCILKIIKVLSPTDVQLDSLKTKFKFALKLTLKSSYMFRCETPSSGSTLSESC